MAVFDNTFAAAKHGSIAVASKLLQTAGGVLCAAVLVQVLSATSLGRAVFWNNALTLAYLVFSGAAVALAVIHLARAPRSASVWLALAIIGASFAQFFSVALRATTISAP